ncbi:MAG: SDR family oxidoreductase [Planctomycetota bacterium]|nr:SDR family oxidoreductase [Planctomycetota bacterium]
MPDQPLRNKTAIVTGAAKGMGRAIAQRLAADGAFVVVNYAGSVEEANVTVAGITSAGGRAIAAQADVSHSQSVVDLFSIAERAGGGVDILVNNAGRATRKPLAEFTDAEFDALTATNLRGTFLTLREAAKRMRENGRVVNISASFQGAPIPGYGPYAATKMAVEQLTAVAAKELGSRGITVNAVRPGPTRTDLFMHGKDDALVAKFAAMAALNRIGEPSDIANVVSFLCGPEGGWVTGQAIGANGGYW